MKTQVTNSRTHKKQPQTWRRRQCPNCNSVFTSYERPDTSDLFVISENKKSTFNIGKLTLSIAKAFQHDKAQAEFNSFDLASTIEMKLILNPSKNTSKNSLYVTNQEIAHVTHQTLKLFDELASVQYAMQHGLITSVRRRGRPSTIATTYENDAALD